MATGGRQALYRHILRVRPHIRPQSHTRFLHNLVFLLVLSQRIAVSLRFGL